MENTQLARLWVASGDSCLVSLPAGFEKHYGAAFLTPVIAIDQERERKSRRLEAAIGIRVTRQGLPKGAKVTIDHGRENRFLAGLTAEERDHLNKQRRLQMGSSKGFPATGRHDPKSRPFGRSGMAMIFSEMYSESGSSPHPGMDSGVIVIWLGLAVVLNEQLAGFRGVPGEE